MEVCLGYEIIISSLVECWWNSHESAFELYVYECNIPHARHAVSCLLLHNFMHCMNKSPQTLLFFFWDDKLMLVIVVYKAICQSINYLISQSASCSQRYILCRFYSFLKLALCVHFGRYNNRWKLGGCGCCYDATYTWISFSICLLKQGFDGYLSRCYWLLCFSVRLHQGKALATCMNNLTRSVFGYHALSGQSKLQYIDAVFNRLKSRSSVLCHACMLVFQYKLLKDFISTVHVGSPWGWFSGLMTKVTCSGSFFFCSNNIENFSQMFLKHKLS